MAARTLGGADARETEWIPLVGSVSLAGASATCTKGAWGWISGASTTWIDGATRSGSESGLESDSAVHWVIPARQSAAIAVRNGPGRVARAWDVDSVCFRADSIRIWARSQRRDRSWVVSAMRRVNSPTSKSSAVGSSEIRKAQGSTGRGRRTFAAPCEPTVRVSAHTCHSREIRPSRSRLTVQCLMTLRYRRRNTARNGIPSLGRFGNAPMWSTREAGGGSRVENQICPPWRKPIDPL